MRSRSSAAVIALGVGDHALAVEADEGRRDLLHASVEFVLEALRLLIGHLDLAHEAALAAPESHPPVRLTQLVPRHRIHEFGVAAHADHESGPESMRRPGEATEEVPELCGGAPHGFTIARTAARNHGQCTSHRMQAIGRYGDPWNGDPIAQPVR
jgi:hypothetical protein